MTHPKSPDGPVFSPAPGPLFLHQLDREETNSHARSSAPEDAAYARYEKWIQGIIDHERDDGIFPSWEVAVRYRHRRWLGERQRTRELLERAGFSRSRLLRWDMCGQQPIVQVDPATGNARVSSFTCRDRFCEPCQEESAWHARRRLRQLMGDSSHLLATLTLTQSPEPLRSIQSWLYESFGRLRRTALWRDAVSGGAWFTEMTLGQHKDHWHVHAHAILQGRWLDAFELSAAWRVASGGSYIVDVEGITDQDRASAYVAKYATKGIGRGTVLGDDRLIEAMRALSGTHLIGTFGKWHGTNLEAEATDPIAWRTLGTLVDVSAAAIRGEIWAKSLLRNLSVNVQVRGGVPLYTWCEREDARPGST